jgi:hypothetical protein
VTVGEELYCDQVNGEKKVGAAPKRNYKKMETILIFLMKIGLTYKPPKAWALLSNVV